ncbi:NAD(P)-binding protein [Cucurbitaria berberidis CBS 394.84]|uniref:NAD(P)-binding protein n=1 Tax=Cucurbitaria berberidis CBS 394.84 TaxID=1168544 RepID=A0A9P4GQN2_9PLEO|nr:NAD(P)-binding protein [Cucurbitaria berberidis CBS 394.84]KAF1849371.1 NAD(P)-binding protein [Cucurbitaria berberidis CBS 394.84]
MALLSGRVIAITGAASGIGLATAHLLASRNATLSIADVNATALEKAERDLKQRFPSVDILPYVLNVSKEEEVQKWIETIIAVYGRLDGAANLAGVIGPSIGLKGIDKQDISEWDFIMSVNLRGVMLCLKHQLRHISDHSGGSIVNASSIAGVQGMANNAAYSASKHGVIGLTRSAAKEVGHRGVRVNAVCPGYIDTPMNHKSRDIAIQNGMEAQREKRITSVALKRTGAPEECAELIVYLLGDGSSFITGNAISVDGGWNC